MTALHSQCWICSNIQYAVFICNQINNNWTNILIWQLHTVYTAILFQVQLPYVISRTWIMATNWLAIVRRALAESKLLDDVITAPDVDTAWRTFCTKVKGIIADYVPFNITTGRTNYSNIIIIIIIIILFTIIQMIFSNFSVKNHEHGNVGNLQIIPVTNSKFKQCRRRLKKELLVSKRQMATEAFDSCSSIRDFWSTYRKLSGRSAKIPTMSLSDGSLVVFRFWKLKLWLIDLIQLGPKKNFLFHHVSLSHCALNHIVILVLLNVS